MYSFALQLPLTLWHIWFCANPDHGMMSTNLYCLSVISRGFLIGGSPTQQVLAMCKRIFCFSFNSETGKIQRV
jgi:hypothetical protein